MTIDLAWISLAALVLVIVLSCTTVVNPGFVSLALAWLIGIYVAPLWGQRFTIGEVLAGFPTDLFLTLVGVTLAYFAYTMLGRRLSGGDHVSALRELSGIDAA